MQDKRLTEDPNDYFGQVKTIGNIRIEDLADLMVKEGSELKKETIVDVLSRAERIKIDHLASGYAINTPGCYARVGIQGTFMGASAQFIKGEQKVVVSFTPGKLLRDVLSESKVDILGVATTGPVIGEVTDTFTGNTNSTITRGNVLRISGNRIKVAGDDTSVGVWLVSKVDQSRTKVSQIITNMTGELIVMIPALAACDYILEVGTQF